MTDETRVLAPRWALWNYQDETWDEVPAENEPGLWLGGHNYADSGYSIVPTATLERAGRIEEAARALQTHEDQWWALDDDTRGWVGRPEMSRERATLKVALRAALSDGGES